MMTFIPQDFDLTQMLPFVTPLGTEDTRFDNSMFSMFKNTISG